MFSRVDHAVWPVLILALALTSCSLGQSTSRNPEPPTTATASSSAVSPAPSRSKLEEPTVANATPPLPQPRAQILPGSGALIGKTSGGTADTSAATGDITLNFVNADVREVLPRVLGDILHLNYTIDSKAQGTVTVQTSRPVRQRDVLPVLEEALHASGLALVQSNGVYRVETVDDAAHAGSLSVTVGSGQAAAAGNGVQMIPLQYVSAADLQRTLQPFVPKSATIQIDPTRNVLILSGSPSDLSTVVDMVHAFDVDWIKGMSFGIVPLQTGAPKQVSDELTTIFGPKGSVPLPGMLSFAPLDHMNAILVVSPQRAYVEQARMWIERLDRGEAENKPQIFEYHVQNSRATDVAKVLTALFSNGQVSTVQPQTAPGTTAATLGTSGFGGLSNPGGDASTPPGLGTGLSSTSQPNGMLSNAPYGSSNFGSGATGQGTAADASSHGASAATDGDSIAAGGASQGQNGLDLPRIRVVADEKNNTLVIYARPRDYRMVEDALKRIDVVPLEVLIEATIAEVTLGNDLQYGLQYFFHAHENQFVFGNTSTSVLASPIPGTFPGFNYILGSTNASVVLNLLSSVTNVHVISSPELLVLDHQSASLLVGNAIPIPTAQIQSTITSGAPIVNTVQYVDTGVILKVTPRVNANGLITLEVGQEVSAVANNAATSATLGPTITERRLQSSVTVQDGQTIALGGLIQDTNNATRNGLPILSDIPVIGAAFGSTDHNVQRTELLVLLSPKIIHNAIDARAATDELRSRLHSLQAVDVP